MQKKKTVSIILISLLAIVIIGVVIGIGLAAYFNSSSVKNSQMQKVLEEAWYIETTEADEDIPNFYTAIEEKSSFEVTKVVEDVSGHYTITANVTSPNIYEALVDYQNSMTSVESDEEMDKLLTNIINSADLETSSQTVTYVETEDDASVQFSDEFVDAMYGYAYTYAMQQFEALMQ